MGAGHFFPGGFFPIVLEGPLSEDTHSLDPAPDKSGGPTPEFFFAPFHIFTFFFPFFHSSRFFFTRWDSRHCRHVAESRLLPASQASLS